MNFSWKPTAIRGSALSIPQIGLFPDDSPRTRSMMRRSAQINESSQVHCEPQSPQDVWDYQYSQVVQVIQEIPVEIIERSGEQKTFLSTLPLDILFIISELLDKVDSTCLALAVKNYYLLHRAKHGKVSLLICPGDVYSYFRHLPAVHERIASFFPGLIFYEPLNKFVTLERREALIQKPIKEEQARIRDEQLAQERIEKIARESDDIDDGFRDMRKMYIEGFDTLRRESSGCWLLRLILIEIHCFEWVVL